MYRGTPPAPIVARAPAEDIPLENRAAKALEATGECSRRLCWPTLAGVLPGSLVAKDAKKAICVCWSDIIVYSVSVGLAIVGLLTMTGSRK